MSHRLAVQLPPGKAHDQAHLTWLRLTASLWTSTIATLACEIPVLIASELVMA